MKGWFLFFIVLAFVAFSIPDLSDASDHGSGSDAFADAAVNGATDNPYAVYAPAPNAQGYFPAPNAQGYSPAPDAQGYTPAPNAQGYTPAPDAQGYSPDAQVSGIYANGNCFNTHARFRQGLSFAGPCDWLPKGAICLIYSDDYRWVVSDYRINCFPVFVGVSNGRPIELIRCYSADYYHVLGTSLIMSVPRPGPFL